MSGRAPGGRGAASIDLDRVLPRWAAQRPSPIPGVDWRLRAWLVRRELDAAAASGADVVLVGDEDAGALVVVAPSPWDSEILGVPTFWCRAPTVWGEGEGVDAVAAELAAQIIERVRGRGELVMIRVDARDHVLARALEDAGFRLMDTTVTFLARFDEEPGRSLEGGGRVALEHARPDDLSALERIARSFRTGHFHADPRLAPVADELYVQWTRNSLATRADAVLVVRDVETSTPVGFITCVLDRRLAAADPPRRHGVIELVAVDASAQGAGVGRALVSGALAWFRGAGATSVEVGTQVDNVRAVRLYQRAGFRCVAFSHTFHAWPRRSGPDAVGR